MYFAASHSAFVRYTYLSLEQNWNFPPNWLTPKIEKISHTKKTTIATLTIALIEWSKAATTILRSDLWEITLRGLIVRTNLNTRTLWKSNDEMLKSAILARTIIKSKIFQPSLRYDPLSKTIPRVIDLIRDSITNTAVKK